MARKPERDLPKGFYLLTETLGADRIGRWTIYTPVRRRELRRAVQERYPTRRLAPFARFADDDLLACFGIDAQGMVTDEVYVIDGFTSEGNEGGANPIGGIREWVHAAAHELTEDYDFFASCDAKQEQPINPSVLRQLGLLKRTRQDGQEPSSKAGHSDNGS